MQLSEHFSFDDAVHTDHSELSAINRIIGAAYLSNEKDLANFLLEKIRSKYGAFHINCWFRGPDLNTKVGGVPTSQHCTGQAADISRSDWTWEALDGVANWIKKESNLMFGQVIRERNNTGSVWLHVSTGTKCEALDHDVNGYITRP